LLESFNDWSEGLNELKDTVVIFIDFAKAFDCVSVPKLVAKLKRLGICGNLLSCIECLLTQRNQQVKVGDTKSISRSVMSGVPQGSILGPIFFIIFINDISNSFPTSARSKLFADDLKSYITLTNDCNASNVSLLIDCVSDWSQAWQLPLSVTKCNWMFISNRSIPVMLSYSINDVNLLQVSQVKDLGVMFDSKLNFSSHITAMISKAKQRLFLLKKSFTSGDNDALVLAFKTYIIPLLEYCSPVWSPCTVTDILRIESVQRSFTKTLSSCSNMSYYERLCTTGLCSLERRRLSADLILLYKIIYKLIDIDFGSSLTLNINSKTRGHSLKINTIPARINTRLHFFTSRTVRVWNCLPDTVVCSNSIASFRHLLSTANLDPFLILSHDF